MNIVESLLREEIGLDAASIGSSIIERIVRLQMKNRRVNTLADYQRLLEASPDAWEELVESVVVTETWFFRDREPFNAFAQIVQQQWLPQHPVSPLRLLSVPCSSGEEPYSLAMALFDANIPRDRFLIDAVDISARALARAKRAVYGKNSFRGRDLEFRNQHFQATREGYLLHQRVRDAVQFHRDNLLSDDFLIGRFAYDVIFCRNLLIYFDGVTQTRTLEKLHRMLAPDGYLFVGPAELPLVTGSGFTAADLPMAFACRKTGVPPHKERRGHAVRIPELPPRAGPGTGESPRARAPSPPAAAAHAARTPPSSPPTAAPPRSPSRPASSAHAQPKTPAPLDRARELADAGHLDEAVALCEEYLRDQGPSAQAYYLLGLVRDARGDPHAIEYYRKALYLEPNHYEALVQASLLLEKNGDEDGARSFKRRARRAQPKVS